MTTSSQEDAPDIVFGTVRAIGTSLDSLESELKRVLVEAQFKYHEIKISDQLTNVEFLKPGLVQSPEDERYRSYMDAGDQLRGATQRSDAAAVLAVRQIKRLRNNETAPKDAKGQAYLLRSLMHPSEISTLKRIYGNQLFVISAFSPEEKRERILARRIADSRGEAEEQLRPTARQLINRDSGLVDESALLGGKLSKKFLLDVRKTFHKADLFVNSTEVDECKRAVCRFIELIFGHPFHTPTIDEYGMAIASDAALRSSSLARSVGAAILSPRGEVIALGTNDAPSFGGGLYWSNDEPDGRDHVMGYDSSDKIRRQLIADFLRRLSMDRSWATSSEKKISPEDLAAFVKVIDQLELGPTLNAALKSDFISSAMILDVIEFGRAVHAEMCAICDAAKRGVSVVGATLYCTTFPCHECAKHIVASGITRVVYIEPYPKSRVAELYEDSIGLADRKSDIANKVSFEPFVGISPTRFRDVFSWVPRKLSDVSPSSAQDYSGKVVDWALGKAYLRNSILDREGFVLRARKRAIETMEDAEIEEFDRRLAEASTTFKEKEQQVSNIDGPNTF